MIGVSLAPPLSICTMLRINIITHHSLHCHWRSNALHLIPLSIVTFGRTVHFSQWLHLTLSCPSFFPAWKKLQVKWPTGYWKPPPQSDPSAFFAPPLSTTSYENPPHSTTLYESPSKKELLPISQEICPFHPPVSPRPQAALDMTPPASNVLRKIKLFIERNRLKVIGRRQAKMEREGEAKERHTENVDSLQYPIPLITERAIVTIHGKVYGYRTQRYRVLAPLRALSTNIFPVYKPTVVGHKCYVLMYCATVYMFPIFRLNCNHISVWTVLAWSYLQIDFCPAFVVECSWSYLSIMVGYSCNESYLLLYSYEYYTKV